MDSENVQMLCRFAHCAKFEAGDACESKKGVHLLHFQAPGKYDAKTKQICRPFLTGTCTWGEKCKTPHATHRADGLWELNGIVFRHSLLLPIPKADDKKVCPAPSAAVEPVPVVVEAEQSPAPSDAVAPAPAPARRAHRHPNPARNREARAQRVPEPAAPAPQIPKPQSFVERARALKALLSQNQAGFDGDALDDLQLEIDKLMLDASAATKIISQIQAQQLDL